MSTVGVLKGPKGLEKFASIFMAGVKGRGFLFVPATSASYFLEDGYLVANGWEAAMGQSMGTCIAYSEAGKCLEGIAKAPKHLPPQTLSKLLVMYLLCLLGFVSREEAEVIGVFKTLGGSLKGSGFMLGLMKILLLQCFCLLFNKYLNID